ncbi:hypothetical protein BC829DRAFT_446020 [Chytridium lagenaria]|nr:hypothetical protein BC829DRAFT_446020 [Chytridium lagenaria]
MALASKDLNRTESKNRFRFQSFNERIKHLKLNATQHVRSRYEYDDPEMGNSFFVEELELLKDLDASVAFREFNFEISQFAQSLQQILFHKEAVVDMLIATLEKKQIIESILKLMVALARDLQDEFTPFFTKVVASILGLLTTREIEIVEAIFNALVLIFRYLHQEVAGLFWRFSKPGFRMVQQAVEMLLHHCKSETVQPLMDQTMEDINATIYAKDRTKEQSLVPVSKALSILNLCLYARKGHLIADWGSIFQIVEHCAQNFSIEEVPTTTISFGLLLSNSPEAFRSDCEKTITRESEGLWTALNCLSLVEFKQSEIMPALLKLFSFAVNAIAKNFSGPGDKNLSGVWELAPIDFSERWIAKLDCGSRVFPSFWTPTFQGLSYYHLHKTYSDAALPNFSSHEKKLRLYSAHILRTLFPADNNQDNASILRGQRLGQVILKYQQVDKKLLETVFQYLFAFLTEKFAPVLGPVTEVLVTLAKKYNHFFWIAYMDVFSKLDQSTLEPEAPTDDFIEENFDAESKLKSIKRLTELSAQLRSTSSRYVQQQGGFCQNLHHASKDFMSEGRDALEGTSKVESLISKDVLKTRDIIFETLNIVKVLDKPEKLFREADVYSLCLQLLTTGDTAMQRLSLECILVWKEAPLVKISEQLRGLTDEVKFRDYLTTLDQESLNSLAEEDKSKVYNVLIRILFGKLISRRKKSSDRTGLKARRKAIFAFFVKLGDFERGLFFDILIQPFRKQIQQFELDMPIEPVSSYSDARGFELKYQLGFLNACEDLVKQFQSLVTPFIPSLLRALLFIGSSTSRHGVIEVEDDASSEIGDEDSSTNKSLRQLTIRRLNDLFSAEITFDYEPYLGDLFKIFIDPKLPNFDTENTQAPTKAVNVSVVELVLSMTEAIFASDEGDKESTFMHSLIVPNASFLIEGFRVLSLSDFFKRATKEGKRDLFSRFIELLAMVVTAGSTIENLQVISSTLYPYLRKPSYLVHDGIKLRVLQIVHQIEKQSWASGTPFTTDSEAYTVSSLLLSSIVQLECRRMLVTMFKEFAAQDDRLVLVSELIDLMNTFELRRLNERDFSKLFDALGAISTQHHKVLVSDQWLPILYNLVYLASDETEFSVRASASHCFEKFFETTSARGAEYVLADTVKLLRLVIFPSIKKAFVSKSETVRSEFLSIMGLAVERYPYLDEMKCFVPLLANGDGEASFFGNYYHLQQHRRVRAVRRLCDEIQNEKITPNAINTLMLPLITHTIFESDRSVDNVLINETINAIGASVAFLSWNKYVTYFLKMVGCIDRFPKVERELIRLLASIVGSIGKVVERISQPAKAEAEEMDVDTNEEPDAVVAKIEPITQPTSEKIAKAITQRIIPPLLGLLNERDDENLERRIPLSISISKALNILPQKTRELELSKLLTKLCQFLKNKRQDVRDSTRNSLKKITLDLGPYFFPFIINELQASLQRGYQRHVLVYTVHHLLTEISTVFAPGSLDSAINPLTSILTEDVFGTVAEEREVAEMKGKLIEMKSRKGMECIQILATNLSKESMIVLLRAAKEVMAETNAPKSITKLKEYFRQISQGFINNVLIAPKDLLILIYGLPKKKAGSLGPELFEVQLKRNDPLKKSIDTYQTNSYLFVEFGFSLLLAALRRGNVSISDEVYLDMLDPIVDCLAKALYSKHSTVTAYALRCIDTDPNGIVDHAAKLLLGIMKSHKNVELSNRQLVDMVGLVKLYLENPQGQAIAFALIKAIMQRKYIFAELYDMMDHVAKTLVTSQSTELINYVVHNLNYEFESGRESVLHLIHSVITKFSETVLYDFSDLLFVALVTALVNDDVPKCRALAAKCLSVLLIKLDQNRVDKAIRLARKVDFWRESDIAALKTPAMRFWPDCLEDLTRTLKMCQEEVKTRLEDDEMFEQEEMES